MNATHKRLLKELRDLQTDTAPHPDIIHLAPISDDNILVWRGILAGTPGTPYAGGRFSLLITNPDNYPLRPPSIRFETRVCHPNVHAKTGEICLDILKAAWSPAWTLKSTMIAISVLLSDPEPSSPLNVDAANLLRCGDKEGYESLVRMYVELYAMETDDATSGVDSAAASPSASSSAPTTSTEEGTIGRSLVEV